jgi:hypothetical protein
MRRCSLVVATTRPRKHSGNTMNESQSQTIGLTLTREQTDSLQKSVRMLAEVLRSLEGLFADPDRLVTDGAGMEVFITRAVAGVLEVMRRDISVVADLTGTDISGANRAMEQSSPGAEG